MRKIITIVFCFVFSMVVRGVTYPSYINNGNECYQTHPSTLNYPSQYEFKSTSAYKPIIQYQTVKPLENDGTVSNIYTTNYQLDIPRHIRKSLDLDDDDEPNAGIVPIGSPIIPFFIVMILYIGYLKIKPINTKTEG